MAASPYPRMTSPYAYKKPSLHRHPRGTRPCAQGEGDSSHRTELGQVQAQVKSVIAVRVGQS
jgi:hypothetical protein